MRLSEWNWKEKIKFGFKFTTKSHPEKGVMSTVFGLISVVSIITAIYLTYLREGDAYFNYGIAMFLTLILSFVGIILGITAMYMPDKFKFFPVLGILLNGVSIAALSLILYAGAYL